MNNFTIKTPPHGLTESDISLVHKICEFYKNVYLLSAQISKRDRFGIYSKIENICLEILNLILIASFEEKTKKIIPLNTARIKTEVLKRFFRIAHELNIINRKKYIEFEYALQEISKMTNGWIKYLK